MPNELHYGDNLHVLRNDVKDESVDLIYLDPPFNSKATYNVLFKAQSGQRSGAQIEAFEDTWHWGNEAEAAFLDVLRNPRYTDAGSMLQAMRGCLRENDMMAYLAMMTARIIELHRVLKPSGSLYLHCDPTASHYLKILLDAVFGAERFRSEIIWKRTSAHSDPTAGYGNVTDTILYFSKGQKPTWNKLLVPLSEKNIASKYTLREADGRRYTTRDLRSPGLRQNLLYDYKGYKPHPNGWSISLDKMKEYDRQGRLYFPKDKDGRIRLKLYLDESGGQPMQNFWGDISPLNSQSQERLGYQTQKPLALLERIIKASSNEGQTVLDPFCGCGTAVHAAEKLGRAWIGIDITHLAISLIERRLRDAFPGVAFDVHGTPKDLEGARDLALRDKYQFQWWAVSLVDAVPYGGKRRGADSGIDGWRYMASGGRNSVARAVVSVKGGDNVSVQMVRDLRGVIEREKAESGLFITLTDPTRPMQEEAAKAGFFDSPYGSKRHPRLQIITIKALLAGAKPDLPPLALDAAFRRAEREDRSEVDQGTLSIPEVRTHAIAKMPKRGRSARPTV